jgi:hypothetical protein
MAGRPGYYLFETADHHQVTENDVVWIYVIDQWNEKDSYVDSIELRYLIQMGWDEPVFAEERECRAYAGRFYV